VFGFGGLAVLDDHASLPFRMPEPGILLVPVAIGVALAAACLAAAFQDDVLGGSFGWRQPLGLLAGVSVALGVVPGVINVADGAWDMPDRTLVSVLTQLPHDPPEGDYRVLWIGDPRAIPVASSTYQPGIGYAITDDGALTLQEFWGGRPTDTETDVANAMRQMAAGVTLRGGRLLAQYGIRYVIVPVADGANGTISAPLPAPDGLVDVLDDQLDLAAPLTKPPNYLIYENTAYTPTRAVLTETGAAASREAGGEALSRADLTGSQPFAVGAPDRGEAVGEVTAGTLHVAVPYDEGWKLTVNGVDVPGRRAFGATLAFDIPNPGTARLTYDTPVSRPIWVVLQVLLWLAMAIAASTLRPLAVIQRRRGSGRVADASPVVDMTAPLPDVAAGALPWVDEEEPR
jgi:hypothetical protein